MTWEESASSAGPPHTKWETVESPETGRESILVAEAEAVLILEPEAMYFFNGRAAVRGTGEKEVLIIEIEWWFLKN